MFFTKTNRITLKGNVSINEVFLNPGVRVEGEVDANPHLFWNELVIHPSKINGWNLLF